LFYHVFFVFIVFISVYKNIPIEVCSKIKYNVSMELPLLTAEDVAQQLRIKKYTVYELIKRGELPSSKVGKQVRVSQEDIAYYLKAGKTVNRPSGDPDRAAPERFPAEHARAADQGREAEIVLCGQDACLDLLLAQVVRTGEPALRSFMGCYNGLIALYRGKVSMAGAHLWDSETGAYNYPFIRRLLPGLPVGVLRLGGRMQGFYVRKGNPLKIQDWKDLSRPELVMINRERGCGTRILLDQKLRQLGIDAAGIRGYDREFTSHMVCAGAVARGEADLGPGCERGAEGIAGAEFIPLQLEWYDFVFRLEDRRTPAVQAILSYVREGDFRQDLEIMGGYDLSQTGLYREF
jgi:putative molybdopterin biosynthesis protein